MAGCASPGLDNLMLGDVSVLQGGKPPLDFQILSERSHHLLIGHAHGSHLGWQLIARLAMLIVQLCHRELARVHGEDPWTVPAGRLPELIVCAPGSVLP